MRTCLIYGLLISFFFSCKKDDENAATPTPTGVSVSGKAQKGPFKKGSNVVIYELNSRLEQTGNSYSTNIKDNAGSFNFNNITLSKAYASITATGYYYMEHFNTVSPNRVYLEAVADVQNVSTINVNILTHLIKPRIEKLVADGNTFSSSRVQAQNELKAFLNAPSSDNTNFEDLTVANNKLLFAASLLFQRRKVYNYTPYNYTNELSHLLISFRDDFRDNGQVNSNDIIDTLIYNANRIQLIDDKSNLENYIASVGGTTSLSGFEQYIYAFQNAWSPQVYVNCVFPDSSIWDIDVNSPQLKRNILYDTAAYFQGSGSQYVMSAIVPCDTSLAIKFTLLSQDTLSYSLGYYYYGWSLTKFSHAFTIEAQRKNYQNGFMLTLFGTAGANSARIEYFMNNQSVPYFSKIIYW